MALARVVSFEGVTGDRVDEMRQEIAEGGQRAEIPATEVMVLYDREAENALVVLFFETEDDYRRGDELLDAMPSDGTAAYVRRALTLNRR